MKKQYDAPIMRQLTAAPEPPIAGLEKLALLSLGLDNEVEL